MPLDFLTPIGSYALIADKLTSVAGFTELLLKGAYGEMTPSQKKVLESVAQAARDACEVVRRSKMGASGIPGSSPRP